MTMQEIDVLHLPGNSVEMMALPSLSEMQVKPRGVYHYPFLGKTQRITLPLLQVCNQDLAVLQENSMALCKYASTREQEMHSWENAYRSTREHFWRTIMHSQQNHIGISTNHFCILGYVQFRINSLVGCTYASEMM